jgi:hypothetical protein
MTISKQRSTICSNLAEFTVLCPLFMLRFQLYNKLCFKSGPGKKAAHFIQELKTIGKMV